MIPAPPNGSSERTHDARTPAVNAIFELLADRRRRCALHFLTDRNEGVTTFDELVDFVVEHAGDARREPIELEFHHRHLPRFVDAGVVDYDDRSDTIRYRGDETLERLLDSVREHDLQH